MIDIGKDLQNAYDDGYKARDAEIVRCKDCKYRPHLRDAVDEDDAEELKHGYFNGFDLRFPTEGKCPCQVLDDEFYSWIPKDDWFCADGERKKGAE